MENENSEEIARSFESAACVSRGHILQRTIELENLIDLYIGKHFSDSEQKYQEMVSLILAPRMTFENKRQVLIYLIEKYRPEVLKLYPNLSKHLSIIIEERNMYAHFPFDSSKEAVDEYSKTGILRFIKLKNTKNYKTKNLHLMQKKGVDNKSLNEWIAFVYDYTDVIRKLLLE